VQQYVFFIAARLQEAKIEFYCQRH